MSKNNYNTNTNINSETFRFISEFQNSPLYIVLYSYKLVGSLNCFDTRVTIKTFVDDLIMYYCTHATLIYY